MITTPKGVRLHIGIFGRRNVGKSTLINALAGQQVAIVSSQPGTTTDPVEKPIELNPIGPVVLIDTAGLDDSGLVGSARVNRTMQVMERVDLAILVSEAGNWTQFDQGILTLLDQRKIPTIVVINKIDLAPSATVQDVPSKTQVVRLCAAQGIGMEALHEAILRSLPDGYLQEPPLLADLVQPGQMVILVVPIDKAAPKGRLILPQVQAIRDLLDHHLGCLVAKDTELAWALMQLKTDPGLVVTDSQALASVSKIVHERIPLTSFSILFARYKGDLMALVQGAMAVDGLKPGDRVLVAESCSHHPVQDDIGTVKIPRWLNHHVGGQLRFQTAHGHDFPEDLRQYRLVIQCGGCMTNRREVLSRIFRAQQQAVPITNYGLLIAKSLGLLERVLQPFPEALAFYKENSK
jgi:[FeFe] hydrogenase H-cluster maturation GTPase HydF